MNRDARLVIHERLDLAEILAMISGVSESIVTLELVGKTALHQYFTLKFLLSKFPTKKFQIISTDKDLRRIGEGLGIRFFSKSDNIEFEESYSKEHILRHNFTFLEYFLYEVRKVFFRLAYLFEKRRSRHHTFKNSSFLADSNVFLLFVGLVLSISLLVFIFYFAVSKTYVSITPDFVVKTVSQNLIFQESDYQSALDTRAIISVHKTEHTANIEYAFNVSTFDLKSVRAAKGAIEIFNELPNEQVFRPNTRFVTQDGLVFRSTEWIKIPEMKTDSGSVVIGRAESVLTADGYDSNGELIGVRGNIPEGTLLDMPGLKFNRDKVYAKSLKPFFGGQNPTVHVLTEEELTKFKNILADKLRSAALDGLKDDIAKSNADTGKNYDILDIPENIHYSDPQIEVVGGIKVGDKITDVTLKGKLVVNTYTFDRAAALAILRNLMNEKLLY